MGLAAAGWLAWRVAGPETGPRFHGTQERPIDVPGRTVTVGRNEFFVREAGPVDAPTVVLIHGWVYDSVGTWQRVIEPLAERFRVIAVDHRNHGKSDRIRGRYSIEDATDEVAAVLNVVGAGPSTIVGYSMGGMIAQALALRHPYLVDRIVLAATGAYPIPRRRWLVAAGFYIARTLGRISPAEGARLSYHYLLRTGVTEPRHARWLWEALLDRDATLYFEGGKAVLRFDSRDWVGRLDIPSLVIIPTEDQLIPPSAQYELYALLKAPEIVEIPGARHEAVMTHAAEIVEVIARFVEPAG